MRACHAKALAVSVAVTASFGVMAPAASAAGKAALGCSPPYVLDTTTDIHAFSEPLVTAGFFTDESLDALLVSLDHNGDGSLCYKVPSGWDGPPATNGAQRAGFVNLVDDKVIDS